MFPYLSCRIAIARCIVPFLLTPSLATASVVPAAMNTNFDLQRRDIPHCAGGDDKGVWACATVTFTDRYRLDIDLDVKDTKGDSHSV